MLILYAHCLIAKKRNREHSFILYTLSHDLSISSLLFLFCVFISFSEPVSFESLERWWECTKSITSIRGTINPKWWSFLKRFEQSCMAITSVIRCLNHTACHYIIIFKHQQMWCDITGFISPCEKSINIKGKQRTWLESGCQGSQWRWTGSDDIFTPSGLGYKQRHKTEKAKKIYFLCLCKWFIAFLSTLHTAPAYVFFLEFFCLCPVMSMLLQLCCTPQEKEVMLLSYMY